MPLLLGGGTPMFPRALEPIALEIEKVVPAPDVTHLHYRVRR